MLVVRRFAPAGLARRTPVVLLPARGVFAGVRLVAARLVVVVVVDVDVRRLVVAGFSAPAFAVVLGRRGFAVLLFGVVVLVRDVPVVARVFRVALVVLLRAVVRVRPAVVAAPALVRFAVLVLRFEDTVLGFWAPLERLVVVEVMIAVSPVSPSARADDDSQRVLSADT